MAVGSIAACALIIGILIHKGLAEAAVWGGLVAALAGVLAAAAAVWGPVSRPAKVALPSELTVPDWVVGRPAQLGEVVQALTSGGTGTVGITTGLYGAGGFGKTMLARMVCADRRVRRRFGGRVYMVTVGRDVQGTAAVAAKVNDVIKLVAAEDATFTDPQLAGARLGALLGTGPRRLLVLDDVWEAEQLAPFAGGGKRCARLVTTRVPQLLAGQSVAVRVDQMSPEQARALLTAGLPSLDPAVTEGLLAATGRWPLLLRLVNTILADYGRVAADVPAQAVVLLDRLRVGGPVAVDDLRGDAGRGLDVDRPQERAQAVRATIGASTSLLSPSDVERFFELGVFAEDEAIPLRLAARLWQATAGLDDRDELQAAQICERLAQLALVSYADGPDRGITLHDVIRDFLRAELGPQRLAELNAKLLDAAAKGLPAASPLHPTLPAVRVAWWDLGQQDRYLWDHLIGHLRDSGHTGDAEAVAGDLRWVGARLERFGPAAPATDMSTVGTPRAVRMRVALTRAAHLLTPVEPTGTVVDVLHSRIADDLDWGPQVRALRDSFSRPRLVGRWPLPDLADPALHRVLSGHFSAVRAVAVAPDGTWLASGGWDQTVRIWEVATGRERAVLEDRDDAVEAVAVAPDGSWLASTGGNWTVRIWDVATGRERARLKRYHPGPEVGALAVAPDGSWLAFARGKKVRIWDTAASQERAVLKGHEDEVGALAVAPNGSWLASASRDQTVRIWDMTTNRERGVLIGHSGPVEALAAAPDGSWLASGGYDGTVRIWDVATGSERAVLEDPADRVAALAVAPDGSWLASAGGKSVRIWDVATGSERAVPEDPADAVQALAVAPDGTWLAAADEHGFVRIRDVATGRERTVLAGHARVIQAVAVAPDSSWLACPGRNQTVRMWDAATGRERAVLTGHEHVVHAVAVASDGSWLASASWDQTVRIWDAATGRERAVLTGHAGTVGTVTIAPDGSWLASGGGDRTVRIWDAATGRERAILTGHTRAVRAVAVAPDGSWLASASLDQTVRIWDVSTGRERAVLTGHAGPVEAVAVAPDGSWLASASPDRTVRIWQVATGETRALMRVENSLSSCAWLGGDALAAGGSAGLYLFGFLAGSGPQRMPGSGPPPSTTRRWPVT